MHSLVPLRSPCPSPSPPSPKHNIPLAGYGQPIFVETHPPPSLRLWTTEGDRRPAFPSLRYLRLLWIPHVRVCEACIRPAQSQFAVRPPTSLGGSGVPFVAWCWGTQHAGVLHSVLPVVRQGTLDVSQAWPNECWQLVPDRPCLLAT